MRGYDTFDEQKLKDTLGAGVDHELRTIGR